MPGLPQPNNTWGPLSSYGLALQTQALKSCRRLFSHLDLLFSDSNADSQGAVERARETFFYWIERDKKGWDFGLPCAVEDLRIQLQSESDELICLLGGAKAIGRVGTVFIPDTNTLIRHPDIVTYGRALRMEHNDYEVVFTPVVLSELDKLKIHHKKEALRESAESVIRRIKG